MSITLHAHLSFDFSREIHLPSLFKPIFNYAKIKSAAIINTHWNWAQINYLCDFMCHDNWDNQKENTASPSTVRRTRKNLFELKIKVPNSENVTLLLHNPVSSIHLYVFRKLELLCFECITFWYSSKMNDILFGVIYVFECHQCLTNNINLVP